MRKCIIVSLLLLAGTAQAQLNVRFDFSHLNNTLSFHQKGKSATSADIDQLIATPTMQTLVRKLNSSDSIARVALQNAAQGVVSTGKAADYQYNTMLAQLSSLDSFSKKIQQKLRSIEDSIQTLNSYLPAGKQTTVTVYFLAGGYSSGFTMGDGDAFYIGTHLYKNDLEAIINTCKHELFHNIQSLCYNRTAIMDSLEKAKDDSSLYAYYLAQNLFVEGAAEYVADIDHLQPTPYIKSEQDHALVNRYRMTENFYLIDRMVTDAYHYNEKGNIGAAYSILFDWNWNNPGYAAGKYIAKALVKAHGEKVMHKYLVSDPMIFLRDYITLTKSKPEEYMFTFTEEFANIVNSICEKVTPFSASVAK